MSKLRSRSLKCYSYTHKKSKYKNIIKNNQRKKTKKGKNITFPNSNKAFRCKINLWKDKCGDYLHSKNILGYRSDCSGFVSFMWGLDPKLGGKKGGGPRTRGQEYII